VGAQRPGHVAIACAAVSALLPGGLQPVRDSYL
jgi:hypothetical protein